MSTKESIRTPLAIGLGAIAGALLRYYISLVSRQLGDGFPWGTFIVNLTGAFGLGFFATWVSEQINLSPDVQLGITAGFFGAYTTFSTYALDAEELLEGRQWHTLSFYWLCTAVLGVLCLETGRFFAQKLLSRKQL